MRCELLSNFLYFCSRNNFPPYPIWFKVVVNCSQIFCTFAVETTIAAVTSANATLWIALKFFVLLQSKQLLSESSNSKLVVNCSQIFCTFAVETTKLKWKTYNLGCELLSNFLYFCSRNNFYENDIYQNHVVNCSQIFCTFAVETTYDAYVGYLYTLWIALKFFVLLQSKQRIILKEVKVVVVNCSQIFCTFAVETTGWCVPNR